MLVLPGEVRDFIEYLVIKIDPFVYNLVYYYLLNMALDHQEYHVVKRR